MHCVRLGVQDHFGELLSVETAKLAFLPLNLLVMVPRSLVVDAQGFCRELASICWACGFESGVATLIANELWRGRHPVR